MRGLNFVLGMMGSHWRVLKGREVGSDGDGRDVWYSLAPSSEQNSASAAPLSTTIPERVSKDLSIMA